jgi:ferredoxin-NADP reductase
MHRLLTSLINGGRRTTFFFNLDCTRHSVRKIHIHLPRPSFFSSTSSLFDVPPFDSKNTNWHRAIVESMAEYGSARRIVFRAEPLANGKNFAFMSGQWVDLEIPVAPGEEEFPIGGYSLASPDSSINGNGRLSKICTFPYLPRFELAIKKARMHLTTKYLHSKLQVGDYVNVKVGGTAFSEPLSRILNRLNRQSIENVVFICGGVGITPLYSMLLSLLSKKLELPDLQVKITFIYSAQSETDLLFLDELQTLQKHFHNENGSDSILKLFLLTATSNDQVSAKPLHPWIRLSPEQINHGQLNKERLLHIVQSDESSSKKACTTSCFVCGPPGLIDDVVKFAESIHHSNFTVFHEKW